MAKMHDYIRRCHLKRLAVKIFIKTPILLVTVNWWHKKRSDMKDKPNRLTVPPHSNSSTNQQLNTSLTNMKTQENSNKQFLKKIDRTVTREFRFIPEDVVLSRRLIRFDPETKIQRIFSQLKKVKNCQPNSFIFDNCAAKCPLSKWKFRVITTIYSYNRAIEL